jgi:phosphotriesterase-related protein
MATVETVRGPIDSADLGRTYMHEHVFVLDADVQQNYPAEWGSEDARVDDAVEKLKALAAQGIRTIVDPTVIGLGRYIPRIQRIAERVPELNIVPATGCYTYDQVPFFFYHRDPAVYAALGSDEPDPMVTMFTDDIVNGITGTGVKAAFLKCAIDEKGLTGGVERVMRAVARTHRSTGVPITVHTHPGTQTGLVVKQVMCDEEGVDATRVVLGHSGDSGDADHLSALADHGFILGMDRFGLNVGTTSEARADILIEMCRRGYADRMVLSHDTSCYLDMVDPRIVQMMTTWTYLYIHDEVLPYIRERGVTDAQIETMLVENPRRYFENIGTY